MDKFDILVSHPLTITSLSIWLPLECECKSLVCLLKWPALLSFDFQDCSIRNYSFCTFGQGGIKRWVKFETKKKKRKSIWLTMFQIKKIQPLMWPHFIIPESLSFWDKSELSRIGVIWLNLPIEKILRMFLVLEKFIFKNLHSFFRSSLLQVHDKKKQQ